MESRTSLRKSKHYPPDLSLTGESFCYLKIKIICKRISGIFLNNRYLLNKLEIFNLSFKIIPFLLPDFLARHNVRTVI